MTLLSELVDLGLSQRDLAKQLGVAQSTVRRRLKTEGLETKRSKELSILTTKCRLCGRDLVDIRRKRCNSCNTRLRRIRAKQAAINYKGGKCLDCGWKGPSISFDFHHPDKNKEFAIGSAANKSWEVIKQELDKCLLLCANCHRVRHDTQTAEFLAEAAKYSGTLLE